MSREIKKPNYEELVNKIRTLEEELKKRPTREEMREDRHEDLNDYDENIKTERDIHFKKNAYIRNRKGIFNWAENVLSLNFNNSDKQKLNQIQIGQDRSIKTEDRILETNTVFITAIRNETANLTGEGDEVNTSNGAISITSRNEGGEYAGLQVADRMAGLGDKEGICSLIYGGGENGIAGIGNIIQLGGNDLVAACLHTEKDITGGLYQQHLKQFVDLLPSSTGGIVPSLGRSGFHYSRLILGSPDGSSWEITIDNSGNLQTNKL